ncbi:MAG: hypothetical protein ACRDIB_00995, partial [Ardenticatenaceae bacterium]
QQVVRDAVSGSGGPRRDAAWCPPADDDVIARMVIREISAHDFYFGRRNIAINSSHDFISHIVNYFQLYYVGNEPETFSCLSTGTACNCWNPPTWTINDATVAACFPNPTNCAPNPDECFWETSGGGTYSPICAVQPLQCRRIRAAALARVFLMLRERATSPFPPRGHVVLPPAAIDPQLGAASSYYLTFYDKVHLQGFSGSGDCNQPPIAITELEALHTHHYQYFPHTDPLSEIAYSMAQIRKGVDWYKDRYCANPGWSCDQPDCTIPVDYLLSEMGPNWRIRIDDPQGLGKAWSGGYPNMRDALSYWNSWLCWLTRRAPFELGLKGWEENEHVLYACIHNAEYPPYVNDEQPSDARGTRNQGYFNADTWTTATYYNAPMYQLSQAEVADFPHDYKNSFPWFAGVVWPMAPVAWRLGPFGACYHVWAQVGGDPNVSGPGTFGTGWYFDNNQAGSIGSVTLDIPNGWSTVYIPFIKNIGGFGLNDNYAVFWHQGSVAQAHSALNLCCAYPDTIDVLVDGYCGQYSQRVYSAMIHPMIVYTSQARTVEIELRRNYASTEVIVGRPIVLGGIACSWARYH